MVSSSYNFIRFTNRGSKLGNYKISINKSQTLGLLSGFYTRESIKNYRRAVLFYDKSKNAIGISFTNDANAEGAFAVTHNPNLNTGSITAHSFFIENQIKQEKFFGQKTPKKIKDDKLGTLFVIDALEEGK